MNTNAESDILEWYVVGRRGGRGWQPPVGEKERAVVIGGRGGRVDNRAKKEKE